MVIKTILSSIKNELFSSKSKACDLVKKDDQTSMIIMTVLYIKVQGRKIKIPFKYPER